MRVPLSWLRDYVDVDIEPDELARRLTMLGMEVSGIERWGSDWQDVVVGELLTVERHPRAERLSLTTVTVGGGEVLEIVCGATNIAPGQRVPVALPGAVLPGGRRIERSEKLGVVSAGMLCSGDELRLTSDAEGILILPGEALVGQRLGDLYGDWVLDIDVKPNRGDALSIVGLAREVAATSGGQLRFPDTSVTEDGPPIGSVLSVDVVDTDLCSRFVGRHVAGIRVGSSPDAVQMRLLAAGVRPIGNVVDASNYVMLELGKPIHTFDAAAVLDRRIVVRRARRGERLETLDHVERDLDPDTLLIADASGPLAIAGVMGGAASEVADGTTDVIVESAIFDPVAIRRTGHRYGLRSEASIRFEKGQEWRLAALGADRTARLVREWAGGSVAVGRVDSAPTEREQARLAYRPARIARLLGVDVDPVAQARLLARVGIAIEAAPEGTVVVVSSSPQPQTVTPGVGEVAVAVIPTWRHDLAIEVDIAEELARVYGYEAVPAVRPHTPMPHYRPTPTGIRDSVREALVGAGLTEIVTHALTSPARDAAFPPASGIPAVVGEERDGDAAIVVSNPLSRDRSVLRRSLVGCALEAIATNERIGRPDLALFEIGTAHARSGDTIHEWWRLCLVLSGSMVAAHWTGEAREADVADAKGIVELLGVLLSCGAPTYLAESTDPLYHPGRSMTVVALGTDGMPGIAGRVGELHPAVLTAWDVRSERLIVAEFAIKGLREGTPSRIAARAGGQHPSLDRDIAVIVEEGRPAGEVLAVLKAAGGAAVERVTLFDIYRGSPLADDEKSLAFRLTLIATESGSSDGVEPAMVAIRSALEREPGIRIRA
ncbi:MAG TPA: phenylalanine--tRNA ligase subunit beta [Candidatus Limnocylindrales bacterium]|nr:phenylalanine--tRNA ligase subunit beta [Candidatus Limnocylindrales bacterium]